MKKSIFLPVFLLINLSSFAQKNDNGCYQKGNSTISAGYGFINVWESLFNQIIENTSSTGPVTLQYEYGITNKISGGILLGYSVVKGTYYYGENDKDFTVQRIKNFSALLVANYHFGKFKKIDPYAGANFGYYHFDYSIKNSNPYYNTDGVADPSIPASVGFAGQAGVKYYFTEKFAGMIEAGYISAAIIRIGVAAKL